jgi:hypothetical protein
VEDRLRLREAAAAGAVRKLEAPSAISKGRNVQITYKTARAFFSWKISY